MAIVLLVSDCLIQTLSLKSVMNQSTCPIEKQTKKILESGWLLLLLMSTQKSSNGLKLQHIVPLPKIVQVTEKRCSLPIHQHGGIAYGYSCIPHIEEAMHDLLDHKQEKIERIH